MSNKLKITIDYLSYEGVATNDPMDQDKVKLAVEETSANEIIRKKIQIADEVVDQVITLPDATTDYLLIFADQDISIKLNGGSATNLNVKTAGTKAPLLFVRGDITSLSISNDSGSIVNVDIIAINI